MKWKEAKESFKDFWSEFKQVKSGIVGLIFLVLFILAMVFEPMLIPFPEAGKRWRDITYWEDNPKAAPPAWINLFVRDKRAVSEIIEDAEIEEQKAGPLLIKKATFTYDYEADIAPSDVVLHANGTGNPTIIVTFERPDGESIDLVRQGFSLGNGGTARISIDKSGKNDVFQFVSDIESRENLSGVSKSLIKSTDVLFSEAEEGMLRSPEALKGKYKIITTYILPTDKDTITDEYLSISGRVYGILGTDNTKRDLWSGVISGIKWAMLIGLLTAFVSVGIGVVYGVISAYYGGWIDAIMQRIFEVFVSVPLLPVLIVMSAVFKPSIWTLILMMCAFYWVGPVKTVRSIGMQIKEETYIEASKALGARNRRLIFKHMVPLLIPYSFASMALYVPRAIVVEASISLLGLGDATIVTWGQILQGALSGGAVLNGLWWWVVPPGLMIAFMGMTFAFVGFAMDKILHPKLRTR